MLDFGINPVDFRCHYQQRAPYRMQAALPPSQRPSWSLLDQLLDRIEPGDKRLQLYRNGPVAPAQYVGSHVHDGQARHRLIPSRIYDLLRGGASLVINRVEHDDRMLMQLCASVSKFCDVPTSANAYASFGGDGTFGMHWDTHDVFAVQLIGRKRWRLWAPTFPLPLSHQPSRDHLAPRDTDPMMDVTLKAGDLLYIPRGWWHDVQPLDVGSLHCSVGTYGPTVYDYLQWCLRQALSEHLDARQDLMGSNADPHAIDRALQALIAFADSAEQRAAFQRALREPTKPDAPINSAPR